MTAPTGLTHAEAAQRHAADGPNEIRRQAATPVWRLIAVQFSSPLVLLLAGAAVLSGWVGEAVDALAVGLIVLLNGLVGFYQEYSAQNAVLALRAMTAPRARVVRDGEAHLLPSAEVVRGDLLLLEAGDVVAADADLVEAHQLATNEAPLTGESLPVEKQVGGWPTTPRSPSDGTACSRGRR